jgi:hypothetical protein
MSRIGLDPATYAAPVASIPPEVYGDAAALLDFALRGDAEGVVRAFDTAVDKRGMQGAVDLARCLAATLVGDAPRTFATLDFPDIEHAGYDARWVARFVSACANADVPTAEALFGAAMVDGQLAECLLTLAGSTVATLRHRAG